MDYELDINCADCGTSCSATARSTVHGVPLQVIAECPCGTTALNVQRDFEIVDRTPTRMRLKATIGEKATAKANGALG